MKTYFALDFSFFSDEKLVAISYNFGPTGELMAIYLLTLISQKGYFIRWNDTIAITLMQKFPSLSEDQIYAVMDYMFCIGFLDSAMFKTNRILTSSDIQKRFFKLNRPKKGEDYPYRISETIALSDAAIEAASPKRNPKFASDVDVKKEEEQSPVSLQLAMAYAVEIGYRNEEKTKQTICAFLSDKHPKGADDWRPMLSDWLHKCYPGGIRADFETAKNY